MFKIKLCRISVQSRAKLCFFNFGDYWIKWVLPPPDSYWCQLAGEEQVGTPLKCCYLPWFIFTLYSISSHSASNNSAAKKGCLIHTLYLLVFIIITGMVLAFGMAIHWLITMPSGRLWCFACSTRHVTLDGNLLVHPSIVIVEFPGMQIGCCLVPIVTWPIIPSFLIKDGWTFFSQVNQIF